MLTSNTALWGLMAICLFFAGGYLLFRPTGNSRKD
jgi:hypothetical protein